jgi:hypothetical protein
LLLFDLREFHQFFLQFQLFYTQYHPLHLLFGFFKQMLTFFLQGFCFLAQFIDVTRYLHLLFLGRQWQIEIFEIGGGDALLTGRASEVEHGGLPDALHVEDYMEIFYRQALIFGTQDEALCRAAA